MRRSAYIDIDDTLGDFKKQAAAFGVPPWEGSFYTTDPSLWTDEQRAIQNATNRAMADPLFWRTMPVHRQAHELLAAALPRFNTFLLTALPSGLPPELHPMVRTEKFVFARSVLHMPPSRVIVCRRAEKAAYAKQPYGWPTPLLIDDAEQNVEEWRAAGGHAFYFNLKDEDRFDTAIRWLKGLA